MKNNKYVLFGLLLLTSLVGCKKNKDPNPVDDPDIPPVVEVVPSSVEELYTKEKNVDVETKELVVYALTGEGFFASDSTGHIFVKTTQDVALGDKIVAKGKYNIQGNRPFVNASQITVLESGCETLAIEEQALTIAEVNELSRSEKSNYGRFIKVSGNIVQSLSGSISLVDDYFKDNRESLSFESSEYSKLTEYVGKRVELEVVLASFNGGFELTLNGNITDKSLTIAQWVDLLVKPEFNECLGFDSETNSFADVYGTMMALPYCYDTTFGFEYTWSAKGVLSVDDQGVPTYAETCGITFAPITADGNPVALETDEVAAIGATVVSPAETAELVEITLTVSRGEESAELKALVKNMPIVEQSVKSFKEAEPYHNNSYVMLKGKVIAKAANQSGSLWGIVIQDLEDAKYTMHCEVTATDINKYSIGNTVIVKGTFRNILSGDRPTIECTYDKEWSGVTVDDDSTSEINYAEACVLEITNAEEFVSFIENYFDYTGKVVKFVNPSLLYSERSAGDSIDISYGDVDNAEFAGKGRYPCFIVSRVDAFFDGDGWRRNITTEKMDMTGYIYAIPGYVDTLAICTIPSKACFVYDDVEQNVIFQINSAANTDVFDLDVNLLKEVTVGEQTIQISWVSDRPEVIDNEGNLTQVTEDVAVTLTGTFTINGEQKTTTIVFNVHDYRGKAISTLDSSYEGQVIRVEGILVGYAGTTSYSSAGKKRSGLVLMDPATGSLMYTINNNAIGGTLVDGYTASNMEALKIGDRLIVKGKFSMNAARPGAGPSDYNANDNRRTLDCDGGSIGIVERNVAIDWTAEKLQQNIIVVDSQEDLEALYATEFPFDKIIKFVGTTEAPLYFQGNGSKFDTSDETENGLRFSYKSNITSDESKITHTHTGGFETAFTPILTAKYNNLLWRQQTNDTSNWFGQIGFVMDNAGAGKYVTGTAASSAKAACIGEMYVALPWVTTLACMSLLDPVNTLTMVNKDFEALLDDDIKVTAKTLYSAEKVELPSSFCSLPITWTSDKPTVIANDGTVLVESFTAEELVTFTGKITIASQEYTVTRTTTIVESLAEYAYQLATKDYVFKDGDKILIVAAAADKGVATTYSGDAVDVTIVNNTIADVSALTIFTLATGVDEGSFHIVRPNNYYLVSSSSNKDALSSQSGCSAATSYKFVWTEDRLDLVCGRSATDKTTSYIQWNGSNTFCRPLETLENGGLRIFVYSEVK